MTAHRSFARARAALYLAVALPAVLVPATRVAAQEKASDTLFTVGHYLDLEAVSDPQISPDGSQIIYTRRWVNKIEDHFETALWIVNADGTKNRFLAKGGGAVWSPDGSRIAYLAEGEPKGAQIFVRWMDASGATTQVTRVEQAPGSLHWSPDGKWLGFSMFVPKPAMWKIDLPAPPQGAKWTAPPRVVDRMHFREDRVGYTENGYTHLFLVPADGGTPRQLTHGDWSLGAKFDQLGFGVNWDWSPDGKTIVTDGLDDPDADHIYRDSYLYAVDVATGGTRRLTTEPGSWTAPAFSPDGKTIAFTGYAKTNFSYRAADLYTMPAAGGAMTLVDGGFDRDPDGLFWSADGTTLYFNAQNEGTQNVFALSPVKAGGTVRPVTSGLQMVGLASMARGGTGAVVRGDWRNPGDVYRLTMPAKKPAELTRLTDVNDDVLGPMTLASEEEVRFGSSGGAKVEGWVVKPPGFDPAKKYPLILEIHGGPHGAYTVGFSSMFQNFAANGYVVLYLNPRGSTSYGTAFGNAIMHAYPGVDYDDLMAGVDAVVGRGYIDTAKMYVSGCSGGGVLSSWVIGHTTRFAAAAVRCPVIDWLSFAGETDVPLFTYNFFDAPYWEKPDQWLKQSSLMYVGHVTTPTLMMTGVLDMRTPMPQTEEFYEALKMRGVPAKLLRFEGEFHGTGSKPSNWMRTQLYMMSWFQQWPAAAAVKAAGN